MSVDAIVGSSNDLTHTHRHEGVGEKECEERGEGDIKRLLEEMNCFNPSTPSNILQYFVVITEKQLVEGKNRVYIIFRSILQPGCQALSHKTSI